VRIGYNEDEQFPGQFELWRANCFRSLAGRAGQRALRDLEAELLAMPVKRLIADAVARDGEVCAVGALLRHRGVPTRDLEAFGDDDSEGTDELAVRRGAVPRLVAWLLVELNDVDLDNATPEERYETVLAWVREQTKVAA